ncbi:type VI secretion system tip protein VgrG [Massilia sp. CCM 8695]|uniref:Type VI secretion system tip protein VgrG n=1 Tax=Massilia frigida TaxID=2609281 RepID=A0ABX0N8P0_9BURK|nr:type VI secretion system Vgr family protein [Massilia frigida]NHZ78997.1 type VI secretion system tip protein VgrG [Massilia frigida]
MKKVIQSIEELIGASAQHRRILRVSFPQDDGIGALLLVNQLDAVESISRDFEYRVELLSNSATLALKDLQGKLMTVELVRGDGCLRYFSGYVFSFRLVTTDGGFAFYEALLGPWVKYLSLRKDNYLFHGKSLHDQTHSIFDDYATLPDWDCRIHGEDPPMTDACQFDETDHNYLHRRWEAAGWHYWYEHSASGHQLVLSDDSLQADAIDGTGLVRFQRHGGATEEDGIGQWSPLRSIAPSSVALSGFNFKHPVPLQASMPTVNQQGNVLHVESYEYTGAYGFNGRQEADRMAQLRMEEAEADAKYFEGSGNNRYLQPGRWFYLRDHFQESVAGHLDNPGKNQFLVLEVRHTARNNYLQNTQPAQYSNTMRCIRRQIPWRPGRGFNSNNTQILAPQTATVVGPHGPDSIHTDQYGRIRVQFHWDREGANDERSSAWLRVASSWAGSELGAAAVPRVGSEVIVQWLGGSPDRPIVTGSVFNERHMPPWQQPTQHALTGLRSRELGPHTGNAAGGRSNHLILDDTYNKIQAQLKSDHQHSQLSLGHITRIEDNSGRKDERGEGWELATNAWGVARAGMGMLLTTEPRNNAAGHAKDMGETVGRLSAARERHEQLSDLAQLHLAQRVDVDQGAAGAALKAQNDGICGGGQAQGELSEPQLVLSSPAGIASSTARSTHIQSDRHTVLNTGEHLSITTGKSLFASLTDKLSVFVYKAGMKLFAAKGKVEIQAQSDNVEIIAEQVLKLISTKQSIEIGANQEILLHAGGSFIRISAKGIEHGTDAKWEVHAASHAATGPQGLDASFAAMPAAELGPHSLRFAFPGADDVVKAMGLVGKPYQILDKMGKALAAGMLAADGRLPRFEFADNDQLILHLGDDSWRSIELDPGEPMPEIDRMEDEYYHDEDEERVAEDSEDFGPYASLLTGVDASYHLNSKLLGKLITNPEGEE